MRVTNEIATLAKNLTEQGYSIIPVSTDKNPTIEILNYDSRKDEDIHSTFEKARGIALRTGGDTKITCFDFDEKYNLDEGSLLDTFLSKLSPSLSKKLRIHSTMNGGHHLIFKSDYLTSNQVLASRATTDEEVSKTLFTELQKGKSIKEAVAVASQDRQRVLVETRGGKRNSFGGYFLFPPFLGYDVVQANPIPELNEEETEAMYNAGYSMCQNRRMNRKFRFSSYKETANISLFKKMDGSKILKDYGWEITRIEGNEVRLKRPGNPMSKDSAIYNLDSNIFYCFSTSTSFISNEGYGNVDMLMELENTSELRDVLPIINKYNNINNASNS